MYWGTIGYISYPNECCELLTCIDPRYMTAVAKELVLIVWYCKALHYRPRVSVAQANNRVDTDRVYCASYIQLHLCQGSHSCAHPRQQICHTRQSDESLQPCSSIYPLLKFGLWLVQSMCVVGEHYDPCLHRVVLSLQRCHILVGVLLHHPPILHNSKNKSKAATASEVDKGRGSHEFIQIIIS